MTKRNSVPCSTNTWNLAVSGCDSDQWHELWRAPGRNKAAATSMVAKGAKSRAEPPPLPGFRRMSWEAAALRLPRRPHVGMSSNERATERLSFVEHGRISACHRIGKLSPCHTGMPECRHVA